MYTIIVNNRRPKWIHPHNRRVICGHDCRPSFCTHTHAHRWVYHIEVQVSCVAHIWHPTLGAHFRRADWRPDAAGCMGRGVGTKGLSVRVWVCAHIAIVCAYFASVSVCVCVYVSVFMLACTTKCCCCWEMCFGSEDLSLSLSVGACEWVCIHVRTNHACVRIRAQSLSEFQLRISRVVAAGIGESVGVMWCAAAASADAAAHVCVCVYAFESVSDCKCLCDISL